MKILIPVVVISLLSLQVYTFCSCSHLKLKADCEKEKDICLWDKDKEQCKQIECSDFGGEEEVEIEECNNQVITQLHPFEKFYCYWSGSKCKPAQECSDLRFDEAINPIVCQNYGDCTWKNGQCRNPECNDFEDKLECNSKYLSYKSTPQYCYYYDNKCYSTETCEGIKSKESCQLHNCYWILQKCTTKDLEIKAEEETDFPKCSIITEKDPCEYVKKKSYQCQWYGDKCYKVTPTSICSDFKGLDNCPKAKCIWDSPNENCIDKTCYDYKCTEPMVYTKYGSNQLQFCEKNKDGDCVEAEAKILGEKQCYDKTNKQFAWTGENCVKCYSILIGCIYTLMMIML